VRTFVTRSLMILVVVLLIDLHSCIAADQAKSNKASQPSTSQPQQLPVQQAPGPQKESQQPAAQTTVEPVIIVAKIGDYTITKDELQTRLMEELRPNREGYSARATPADAQTVLAGMLAEKATIIEARKQGYLNDPEIRSYIERYRKNRLANRLLAAYLEDKVPVTGDEIGQKLAADPNLGPARAKEMIQRAKAKVALDQLLSDLLKKFQVKKISENFPKAAQLYQRLLTNPKESRSVGWIINKQIRNELTNEEKSIVLATFEGGQVTLQDWFEELNEIAPPSRPKDLNTPKGVDQLLDRALRLSIVAAEAKTHNLDKNPELLKQIITAEDYLSLYKIRTEKLKDIKDPNEQQIREYFEKNKESLGSNPNLKIDQIWCADLKAAQQVKTELDNGGDFQQLKQKLSLYKNTDPVTIYPSSEGMFWSELAKAEPNQIVGPLKGFCPDGVKWRVAKILEKKPGTPAEYTDQTKGQAKSLILGEQRKQILDDFGREILKKYPHEIYTDKIKDIDPLNIP